jgi:hypothetical protein
MPSLQPVEAKAPNAHRRPAPLDSRCTSVNDGIALQVTALRRTAAIVVAAEGGHRRRQSES